MTTAPLVSIVIPCYNQARYLPGALASLHRQTWPAIESIVIDDGSSDDTSHVASTLGASIVKRQPNRGLSSARNAGLALAHGEFVVFLDADDELLPDAVSASLAAFERSPQIDCVAGRCVLMDSDGRPLPATYPAPATSDLYAELLKTNFVWTPGAAMFRTEAIRAIGGFPADYPAAADYAVMLSFARRGTLALEPRAVVRYRKHDTSMSFNPMVMLRATLAVLKREEQHISRRQRPALADARRHWRWFYGEHLNMQLRREWRGPRRWPVLVDALAFYLRHSPRNAATHFCRKLTRVIRQLPPADIESRSRERARPLL